MGEIKMKVWIKALLVLVIVIFTIKVSAYAVSGTWQPVFAMDSGSMNPNMYTGDVIFVQSPHRTNITTYEDGERLNYQSFNEYGDVIIYHPYGNFHRTPILHRAMYWVEEGEPMWANGSPAAYAGYITKGDNNRIIDQATHISNLKPVKPEWIIGVARVRIPSMGYLLSGIYGTLLTYALIYATIVGYLLRRNRKFLNPK
jgi:signal peptidase